MLQIETHPTFDIRSAYQTPTVPERQRHSGPVLQTLMRERESQSHHHLQTLERGLVLQSRLKEN